MVLLGEISDIAWECIWTETHDHDDMPRYGIRMRIYPSLVYVKFSKKFTFQLLSIRNLSRLLHEW